MATYRIRRIIERHDLQRGGNDYLRSVKAHMIRELADHMFEVFGDLPIKTDPLTDDRYFEFTLGAWEDYEVKKVEARSYDSGFNNGALRKQEQYETHIEELLHQLDAIKKAPAGEDRDQGGGWRGAQETTTKNETII